MLLLLIFLAVCYRTDFRGGSGEEATEAGDKVNRWNLMVSYYPRTKVLYMNGMVEYQKVWVAKNGEAGNPTEICEAYCEHIATEIMKGIDEVRASKPLVSEAERTLLKAQAIKLMDMDCPEDFLARALGKPDASEDDVAVLKSQLVQLKEENEKLK